MENVPVHVNRGNPTGRNTVEPYNHPVTKVTKNKGKKKTLIVIITSVILIAGIVAGGLFIYRSRTDASIDTSKYQAVFLNSGAVYFGKLEVLDANYLRITQVYYLQTQAADTNNPQPAATSTATNLQLVKLGSELQGPTDEMIINRDQVTFFENLKSDGKVTQAINNYQGKK